MHPELDKFLPVSEKRTVAFISLAAVPYYYYCLVLLWSPYGIGQTIIFLPCAFFFLA